MGNAIRIDTCAVFERHPFAAHILKRLDDAGHDAVLIGGVVRDGVRAGWGEKNPYPPDDVDIATSALPQEIRELFRDRTIVGVGEEFGVLVIVAPDGWAYEVATFRVEGEYDGRWPRRVLLVRDLAGDVARRDFTMNGLAATSDGTVIDLVGGVDDLRRRCVRAIGDPGLRFAEDYLRMLRAVRFACQVDGWLDPATSRAIAANSVRLSKISWERIRSELLRTLETPHGSRGLALMDELGLLPYILPELMEGKGVPQPEVYHPEGDVYVHTLEAVRVADAFVRDPLVKLAVALHDIGKPEALERNAGANMGGHCALGAWKAKRVAQRLRLSRVESLRLVYLIRHHMRIADLPAMGRGKQVRFLTEGEAPGEPTLRRKYPLFFDLLQLLVADCEASAHRSSGWGPILRHTLTIAEHVARVGDLQRARSVIDGNDLLRLGERPGPHLGETLNALHDAILAGEIATREEALAEAGRRITSAQGETFDSP